MYLISRHLYYEAFQWTCDTSAPAIRHGRHMARYQIHLIVSIKSIILIDRYWICPHEMTRKSNHLTTDRDLIWILWCFTATLKGPVKHHNNNIKSGSVVKRFDTIIWTFRSTDTRHNWLMHCVVERSTCILRSSRFGCSTCAMTTDMKRALSVFCGYIYTQTSTQVFYAVKTIIIILQKHNNLITIIIVITIDPFVLVDMTEWWHSMLIICYFRSSKQKIVGRPTKKRICHVLKQEAHKLPGPGEILRQLTWQSLQTFCMSYMMILGQTVAELTPWELDVF